MALRLNLLLQSVKKFHGHVIIDDYDIETSLGHDVLELEFDESLVIKRHYTFDKEAIVWKNNGFITSSDDIIKGIQEQFGSNKFLITQSALDLVKSLESY